MRKIFVTTFIVLILPLSHLVGQEKKTKKPLTHEFSLDLNGEYRYFFESPQFAGQKSHFPSLAITPEYSVRWDNGFQRINAMAFLNVDRDENRTYWDIRELYYQKAKNNWELNVGLKKIFWGVTESNHLVDIINQTDALKSFDGEQKLGQPMVQFSWITSSFGTLDFFYLPYHRKRRFSGVRGRFRFNEILPDDLITYESKHEAWHPDFSLRWKHYIGAFDFGLSYFNGSGREPYFEFDALGNINAFYPLIQQLGIDLQLTLNAVLLKIEAIHRSAQQQDFFAAATGFEYTFSNINGQGLDIGVLGEYNYDERGAFAISGLQNDLFYGSRIAFNDSHDTAILIGGIKDLDTKTNLLSLEASRRIFNNLTLNVEVRIFETISEEELFLGFFKNDSYLNISFSKYF